MYFTKNNMTQFNTSRRNDDTVPYTRTTATDTCIGKRSTRSLKLLFVDGPTTRAPRSSRPGPTSLPLAPPLVHRVQTDATTPGDAP